MLLVILSPRMKNEIYDDCHDYVKIKSITRDIYNYLFPWSTSKLTRVNDDKVFMIIELI
jgi:hypothetical protein